MKYRIYLCDLDRPAECKGRVGIAVRENDQYCCSEYVCQREAVSYDDSKCPYRSEKYYERIG